MGSWAAPRPDKSPAAALYGAPAPRDCPLQRVEVATGYGCEESQECNTQYDEKCSTEYERQCRTEYENKCSTSYESQCTTVEDEKCETGYEVRKYHFCEFILSSSLKGWINSFSVVGPFENWFL